MFKNISVAEEDFKRIQVRRERTGVTIKVIVEKALDALEFVEPITSLKKVKLSRSKRK